MWRKNCGQVCKIITSYISILNYTTPLAQTYWNVMARFVMPWRLCYFFREICYFFPDFRRDVWASVARCFKILDRYTFSFWRKIWLFPKLTIEKKKFEPHFDGGIVERPFSHNGFFRTTAFIVQRPS